MSEIKKVFNVRDVISDQLNVQLETRLLQNNIILGAEGFAEDAAQSAALAQQRVIEAAGQVSIAQAAVSDSAAYRDAAIAARNAAIFESTKAQTYASEAQDSIDSVNALVVDANGILADTAEARDAAQLHKEYARDYMTLTLLRYDEFDDRYLGSKSTAPTRDNDGNFLMEGAMYWNSVQKKLFLFNGLLWSSLVDSFVGGMSGSGNLIELTDTAVARTNLGVDSSSEVDLKIANAQMSLGSNFVVPDETAKDALVGLTLGDKVFVLESTDGKWMHYLVIAVTDGAGSTSTYEIIMDEDTYLNANTAASIKNAYESNADTNAYTDADKGFVSASTVLDTTATTLPGAVNELTGRVVTLEAETTDLGIANVTDSTLDVTSSDGASATVPAVTPTTAGVMTGTDKTKLDGIEAGATGDQTAAEIEALYESNLDTNKYTDAEKAKLGGIEELATADQTAAEIEVLYESNADTNKYTDAEKAKVGYISVATSTDLDVMKAEDVLLKNRFIAMKEPTGFDRSSTDTMGILELCEGAAGGVVHRIDQNSVYSKLTGQTTFGDGVTPLADRTIMHRPVPGYPIKVWVGGEEYTFTTAMSGQFSDAGGMCYTYYTESGLNIAQDFNPEYFRTLAITCVVYGNCTEPKHKVVFADERHGIQMDGATHRNLHFNHGTKYESGLAINGLVSGGTTYTSIDGGVASDEDILIVTQSQIDTPFWYIDGSYWRGINNGSTLLAYKPSGFTRVAYNQKIGMSWQLTELTGSQFMVMFFVLTNDREFPSVKILGQNVYATRNAARDAVFTEANNLSLFGLPSPEFKFLHAVIVNSAGALQLLEDGSTHLDLRKSSSGGVGQISLPVDSHNDLLNRDAANAHPASSISLVPQGNLSSSTVQLGIYELQEEIDTLTSVVEW